MSKLLFLQLLGNCHDIFAGDISVIPISAGRTWGYPGIPVSHPIRQRHIKMVIYIYIQMYHIVSHMISNITLFVSPNGDKLYT